MEYTYNRKINYYETDKMGIVHHSNYIRFMEEARTAYLKHYEIPYKELEEKGIIIPTINVNCTYKHHVTYDDTIYIKAYIKTFNGIRLVCGYEATDYNNNTVFIAESTHCFTASSIRPINLRKTFPDIYEKFISLVERSSL